jgi:hypothetical protein
MQRIGRPLDDPGSLLPIPQTTIFTNTARFSTLKGSQAAPGGQQYEGGQALGATGQAGAATLGATGLSGGTLGGGGGRALQGPRSLALRSRDWQHSEWLKTQTQNYAK